ncbi:hypothetical protein PHYPSEUDO_011020 [Phytophthora pseudosyringae]|uniref:Tetratricopeptide repeat protein n=1 Tax=Phytophthora pseudosyringae TaxID=221518 RepID=A0A8T1V9V9_9STRA|nr:hypothetical protein PHYPSEUDO_011020 [Phytophthora pseudosyringae]
MMPRRTTSRVSSRTIRTLIEEAEDVDDEEEEDVVERDPVEQVEPDTDMVTVTVTVVQPATHIRPRQHLIRRSSSAVDRVTIAAPQEENKDGGDKSLRPRFLQERSATIVHISPQTMDPSRVPRSKASAFLLGVVAKAKGAGGDDGRCSPLEPLRPGVTNTLPYVPKQGIGRGVPLRMAAGRNTRHSGHQVSIGPSPDLLDGGIPEAARKRRVSASQEHIAAVVRALRASKQQMQQQLDILHSILRFINATERDAEGKRQVLKEIVDVGVIPELASIMREFRFHTGLQVCVMSILSALAEESPVNAYRMSELNLKKLLQKTAAVHATEDQLVMLALSLVHAIEDSKHTVNIPAYQAEKAAKVRRQSATYTDLVVAAITPKSRPALSPPSSATSRRVDHQGVAATEIARSRALISSASSTKSGLGLEKSSLGQPAGRQHQVFALDVAPPALSTNYRLLFSQKLRKAPLRVESDKKEPIRTGDPQEKRHRPASSPTRRPLPLDLTSRTLAAAIYSGGPVFVEPSPLSKRLAYRGSFSAGGIRRKLSIPRKIQGVQTERLPPTLVSTSPSPAQPTSISLRSEKAEASPVKSSTAPVIEGDPIVRGTEENDSSEEGASSERREELGKKKKEEDDDDDEKEEEESYEDDFDTTGDDEGGAEKKMPSRHDSSQIGSDGELMDIIHGKSDEDSARSASLTTAVTVEAATTIQRHTRGLLVRRELARPSRSKSAERAFAKTASRMTNSGKREKLRPKGAGNKGKRIPLSARAHRQLHCQGSSRCGNLRIETGLRSVRPVTAMSPALRATSKVSAPGMIGAPQQRQEMNNQLVSPSRSLQLGFPLAKHESLQRIQTLYAEGLQHHKENHLGLAAECYEKALATPGGPSFASLHVNLGSALLAQNKFSEALASLEQAQRIQPNNVKAMYNYSLALLHLDRPPEAQRLLRHLLELDPTHENAILALSHLQGSPSIISSKHDDSPTTTTSFVMNTTNT